MRNFFIIGCIALTVPLAAAQNSALPPNAAPNPAGDVTSFSGKVLETTNTAGYTYVCVESGGKKLWAASTQFAVNVGDDVSVASAMPMSNYHSKTLNRDFELIYFTGRIDVNGATGSAAATPALPSGHPSLAGQAPSANLDLSGIQRAEGGKTIQEIYAAKAELAGKPVSVRGKVAKYNAMIMGKNWLHIRDGSGDADKGDNDLTVTTATPAKLGDTVLVTGNISTNRDFGAGYKYSVIIEDAKVAVE